MDRPKESRAVLSTQYRIWPYRMRLIEIPLCPMRLVSNVDGDVAGARIKVVSCVGRRDVTFDQ